MDGEDEDEDEEVVDAILGERVQEISYDWGAFTRSLPEECFSPSLTTYFEEFCHFVVKSEYYVDQDDWVPMNPGKLNLEQRRVYNLLEAHLMSARSNPTETNLVRLTIHGGAG